MNTIKLPISFTSQMYVLGMIAERLKLHGLCVSDVTNDITVFFDNSPQRSKWIKFVNQFQEFKELNLR